MSNIIKLKKLATKNKMRNSIKMMHFIESNYRNINKQNIRIEFARNIVDNHHNNNLNINKNLT